ncbi:MAG: hypothetical protein FJ293_04855 [Planctomycetes bacterium]|nr:hypothetical protein [Planctomycetota bacterium]
MKHPRLAAPQTLADLRRALDAKERDLRELLGRQQQLAAEVNELGETLQAMLLGGSAAPGRRQAATGRGKGGAAVAVGRRSPARGARAKPAAARDGTREGSLTAFIRAVLERVVGPLRVSEICAAVQAAGYASKSENLGIIVANRLAQMDDVERVERGLYQLQRDAPAATAAN